MGLLYGENCIILTSNAFDWSTHVTDGQTDGQTELPRHIRAIAYNYAVMRKNQSGFYWSNRQWVAVASAGPYANRHL